MQPIVYAGFTLPSLLLPVGLMEQGQENADTLASAIATSNKVFCL